MEEQSFKPITEEPPKTNENNFMEIPTLKEEPKPQTTENVVSLPKWSIEPPVEINRRQQ